MNWYRKYEGAYHKAADDYVNSGRSICGRSIFPATYTARDEDLPGLRRNTLARICGTCLTMLGWGGLK